MILIEVVEGGPDFFIRNEVMVVAREVETGRSAWCSVSRLLLDDTPMLAVVLEYRFDELLHPWKYPDRPWGWVIDPFPGWTRFARWITTRSWWR